MASLNTLPPDQRAVLQLVLQRGRSYDDIARMLSIDRAAVRERALSAFDALGPQTGIAAQRRALITDYLLGQLPRAVAEQTRDRLAQSSSERAWARVLASELTPIAAGPLPEIPVEATSPTVVSADAPAGSSRAQQPVAARSRRATESDRRTPRPSSRRGGAVLIAAAAAVVVIVVVVLLSSGGSSDKRRTGTATRAPSATSRTGSTAARVVAQINLTPTAAGGKAAGIAEILKEGVADGIAIVAQNVTPNSTKPPNAYAVWLYNSASSAHLLGFVNPGVGATGKLSTAGGLPTNASQYKQVVVTVETKGNPTTPGTIILQGTLTGLS